MTAPTRERIAEIRAQVELVRADPTLGVNLAVRDLLAALDHVRDMVADTYVPCDEPCNHIECHDAQRILDYIGEPTP